MKKMFSTMMLFAAAAMAFVSCQKNEIAPEYEQTILTFTSSNPETKTEWNGSTIVWSAKDKIRVACLLGQAWQNNNGDVTGTAKAKLYQSNGLPEDKQAEAKFTVPTNFNEANFTGKTSKFYAIYPDAATDVDFTAPNAVVTIPSTQSVAGDTFDKNADLLWGKSEQVAGFPTEAVSMYWTRLVAHADITLKGLGAGEKVNSVVLTAQDGLALVGKFNVDITTGEVSSNTPQNTVTVNCTDLTVDETGEASFWACINPCTITSLDIVVDTDAATYTISKTGFEREFLQNKRNTLPINMAEADRVPKETGEEGGDVDAKYYVKVTEAPEDWSGTYVLVCESTNEVMKGPEGTNKYCEAVSVTISNNTISSTSLDDACVITVAKVSGGNYCLSANEKYIGMPKDGTDLSFSDSLQDTGYYWSFNLNSQKNVIISNTTYTERVLARSSTTNTKRFTAYKSYKAVQLYRLQD
ncbi:MAG: fimbrillin family protein [Bacteroidales bacterium]|nr:fimbrillin family protein [Bacteroidales bacterium]